jgi:hypothetical protein
MSCDGRMIGRPLAGLKDVVGRHHEHARFHLRLERQRHVHGHLVAVEVGVERRADERVQLDRLASMSTGSKAWMPRRCSVGAVQQNGCS